MYPSSKHNGALPIPKSSSNQVSQARAPSLVVLPASQQLHYIGQCRPVEAVIRCAEWSSRFGTSAFPPRVEIVQTRSAPTFPISYERTRVDEEGGDEPENNLITRHSETSSNSTALPPIPASSASTPRSLPPSLDVVTMTESPASVPPERRSSVDSNFSIISTVSSSSSSSHLAGNGLVEREWWRVDTVSVMNCNEREKKKGEDHSNWKVIAW